MTPGCRILQLISTKMFLVLQVLLVISVSAGSVSAITIKNVTNATELRDAVILVNLSFTDTEYIIRMAPGTYVLSSGGADDDQSVFGDLDIAPLGSVTELTLESSGGTVILDGDGAVRVVEIFPHPTSKLTLNINNVTIKNGTAGLLGGGVFVNSAPLGNEIAVNLNGVTLYNNTAIESGGAIAAGLNNLLTIKNSTVSTNSTDFNGAGLFCFGCSATITNTLFSDNIARPPVNGIGGGAIFNCGGTVTIDQNSTIQDNETDPDIAGDWYGGALANTGTGAMTVSSIISHSSNSASGLFNQGGNMSLTLNQANPTLPGDLVILSGNVSVNLSGTLNVAGVLYDPGGNLVLNKTSLALPWLLLLL